MKKSLLSLILLLVIVCVIVPFYLDKTETLEQTQLRRFSSYEELKSFLKTNNKAQDYEIPESIPLFLPREAMGKTVSIPEFSTTNIQVAGVDEADIVKTDGTYLYVVTGSNIFILKAHPPEEVQVFSQMKLNGTLRGIFINGDKLVVLEDEFSYYTSYEMLIPYETPRTFIKVYDVSDRKSPVIKRNFSLDGYYFNSGMIGDYAYAVINKPAYLNNNNAVVLPNFYSEDVVEEIYATEIYYSSVSDDSYTFTTIVAINVQNDEQEPAHETFLLGSASSMYVSLNNIYITFREQRTSIHRIHVENGEIEYEASGEVPGYVLNQFSMDEYQGYFRIATTTGHVARTWSEATSRNNVYILDANLNIVGKLEDLAPGETIYSARFMGERCYLVTFRKIDPLFVIDLENPYAPEVLGYLKITGYSDYLHPYDENHIIGIGKETEAAEEGDFAWYQGVKISLFDITDVTKPKEIAKYEIGDRGTDSPVLSDHKAFLFDKSRNLLVIPVLVAEIDEAKYPDGVPPNAYGDYVWQGAYVFDISLDGLVLEGRITHLENDTTLTKSGYYFSSPYSVKRSLYIDNVLYTISNKKVKMNNLETLDEIKEVELP